MKQLVLGLAVIFGIQNAHAIHCTLNKENPTQPSQFDQPVINTLEVLKNGASNQMIVIKASGEVLENFELGKLKSAQEFKAVDKSTYAVISKNADGSLAVGIGHFDLSQAPNNFQMHTLAIGDSARLFGVIDYQSKLALMCF